MDSQDRIDALIIQEAIRWVVELSDSPHSDPAALPPGFSMWLSRSERHRAAFIEAEQAWRRLNSVDSQHRIDVDEIVEKGRDAVVVPFPMRPGDPGPWASAGDRDSVARMRRGPWAAGACLVGLLAISYGVEVLHAAPVTYRSGVGHREFIPLEDGSTMELNTRTRVEVRYGPHSREVTLVSGEASFDVKHDAQRPFRVVSGATAVQDVGTQFEVLRKADGTTRVMVLEGQVEVTTGALKNAVDEGQLAVIGAQGALVTVALECLSPEEISRRVSWQTGTLTFYRQSLVHAVEEINRYNVRQLVIADPSLATLQVGGTFRAVDLESFLAALAVLFDVRAAPSPEDANVIELKRSPASR